MSNNKETFLWYDLETFGLNPSYDRIAQIAAIRTDMDFNITGDPLLMYIQPTPDYLPNPESCTVTGITPFECREKGIKEADAVRILNREMSIPNTIVVGFNNIKFDDEMFRYHLYRNLYDPYAREYSNGCSKWDIFRVVVALSDLRPEGINFSVLNKHGMPEFKLTTLTEENNIDQTGAHDALVDVKATIAIAKLMKEKQPRFFDYALSIRKRDEVMKYIDIMNHTPFLYSSMDFLPRSDEEWKNITRHPTTTHPVLPLFQEEKNTLWCFDLLHEIPKSNELKRENGFYRIKLNACPFVSPLNVLNNETEYRLGYSQKEIEKSKNLFLGTYSYDRNEMLSNIPPLKTEEDVDLSLYSGFASKGDKSKLSLVQSYPVEDKIKKGTSLNFENPKYLKLIRRYVSRSWPEALNEEEMISWRNFCSERLLSPPVKEAKSIKEYFSACDEIIKSEERNAEDKKIALELKKYGEELENDILRGKRNEK